MTSWVVVSGACYLAGALYFLPEIVPWLLPVAVPMIAAAFLVSWSSGLSTSALFHSSFEDSPSPVLLERERVVLAWTGPQELVDVVENKPANGGRSHA